MMRDLDSRLSKAVQHFWATRTRQDRRQGRGDGRRDAGNRRAATGGKQLDGFTELIVELLVEAGLPRPSVFGSGRKDVTIPGFFRPTKQWDVLVVAEGNLLACVECKSLCGPSFGNNYNNRIEEAIGSASDLWTAYRDGVFDHSPRPFAGYVLLLEEAAASTRPVRADERHFAVLKEFQSASYEARCRQSVFKLMRERCYDACCLVLSERASGMRGRYREPDQALSFGRFARSLCNRVTADFSSL